MAPGVGTIRRVRRYGTTHLPQRFLHTIMMQRVTDFDWSAPKGGDYSKAHGLSIFGNKQNVNMCEIYVKNGPRCDRSATFAGQREGKRARPLPGAQVAPPELG